MLHEGRPLLSEAPEQVTAAVAEMLGEPVVEEHPAAAGFTPSIASIVIGRSGARLFVKAAPHDLGTAVEAGAVLADAVGDLGPRLIGFAIVESGGVPTAAQANGGANQTGRGDAGWAGRGDAGQPRGGDAGRLRAGAAGRAGLGDAGQLRAGDAGHARRADTDQTRRTDAGPVGRWDADRVGHLNAGQVGHGAAEPRGCGGSGRGGQEDPGRVGPWDTGQTERDDAGRLGNPAAGSAGCGCSGRVGCGDWRVAAYEVVEGETVSRWTAADVSGLLTVAERMRQRLEPCPVRGVTPYAADFVPLLGDWRSLGKRRPPPDGLPVELLAELESRWTAVLTPGNALHHGDLRRDNMIREPGGRLRIVDWTHLWTAPGWMDLVRLLPDVAACGIDPETVLRRSCWRDVPDDQVNVALAGLAGRAWRDCALPGEPRLRRMQAQQAGSLLAWLSARLSRPGG